MKWKDFESEYKKILINQINNAPKELESWVHTLEAGCDGSILFHNEQSRQENEELKFVLNRREYGNRH